MNEKDRIIVAYKRLESDAYGLSEDALVLIEGQEQIIEDQSKKIEELEGLLVKAMGWVESYNGYEFTRAEITDYHKLIDDITCLISTKSLNKQPNHKHHRKD